MYMYMYICIHHTHIFIQVVHDQPSDLFSINRRPSVAPGPVGQGQSLGHAVTSRLRAKAFALEASLRLAEVATPKVAF